MKPARKRKLLLIGLVLLVLSAVTGLVTYAFRENISLFYTPSQVVKGEAPLEQHIRLGGMVLAGSVHRHGLSVQFKLNDYQHRVTVTYRGILPDLFREGQGIVAEGQLVSRNQFKADVVLAKHDANYMPAELKAALVAQQGRGERHDG